MIFLMGWTFILRLKASSPPEVWVGVPLSPRYIFIFMPTRLRGQAGAGRVPENKSGRGFEGNKEGKYLTISPGGTKAPQSNYDIDLLAFDYAWMKHGRQLVAPRPLNFLGRSIPSILPLENSPFLLYTNF